MRILLICLITVFLSSTLIAQDKQEFEFTIPSEAFAADRKFYVHVPERYNQNKTDSLGVIFILDSQSKEFFNNAKSIIDYLIWSYQIPPMIMVGIHSENRNTEFIPLNNSLEKDNPDNAGQAELLRKHLSDEVFPMLESKFRINKFKALIGHSRAGAFIANTIFSDNNDMFNAYIAISPGMDYLNRQILNDAATMIKSNAVFNNFYYCTYGTVGSYEPYFEIQVQYLDSLFQAHPNETIHWDKKKIPGTTHWTVVAPSIVEGLIEMSRAYQVDQVLIEEFSKNEGLSLKEQIDTYYKKQEAKLKYVIPPNAPDLRYYGNEMQELKNYTRAIELYDLSLSYNKNELRTYYGKAGALSQLKKYTEAEKVYKEAIKILELNVTQLEKSDLDKKRERIQQLIADLPKSKD